MEWRIDRYESTNKLLLLKTIRELCNYKIFALHGSKTDINVGDFDEYNSYENILLVPSEKLIKF